MTNLLSLYFYLDRNGILNLVYEDIYAELDLHLVVNGSHTHKIVYSDDLHSAEGSTDEIPVELVSALYELAENLAQRDSKD